MSLRIVALCLAVHHTRPMTMTAPAPTKTPRRKPNRVRSSTPPDLTTVAFVRDSEAARYLGLSLTSVYYLVTEGKLKRVYPRPRAARITVESLTMYREAVEAGQPPRIWTQPGNPHTAPKAAPTPEPEKKKGILGRWGIGRD